MLAMANSAAPENQPKTKSPIQPSVLCGRQPARTIRPPTPTTG